MQENIALQMKEIALKARAALKPTIIPTPETSKILQAIGEAAAAGNFEYSTRVNLKGKTKSQLKDFGFAIRDARNDPRAPCDDITICWSYPSVDG